MKFECKKCGNVLTKEVVSNPVNIELNQSDGVDLLPKGFTVNNSGWGNEQWVINLCDNKNMVRTDDPSRLNGCCGADGCDGMNLVCNNCSNYVATERSDCWMPWHIILSNEETSKNT